MSLLLWIHFRTVHRFRQYLMIYMVTLVVIFSGSSFVFLKFVEVDEPLPTPGTFLSAFAFRHCFRQGLLPEASQSDGVHLNGCSVLVHLSFAELNEKIVLLAGFFDLFHDAILQCFLQQRLETLVQEEQLTFKVEILNTVGSLENGFRRR